MSNRITVLISTKDRGTELALLLSSLLQQTVQDFDIIIVDGSKPQPLINYVYFVQSLVNRLKLENHKVVYEAIQVDGVCASRQRVIEIAISEFPNNDLLLRIDDDTILTNNYLEKLLEGINAGYDMVSGLTPTLGTPEIIRENKYVKPIINEIQINDKGEIIKFGDDCWSLFPEEEIIPTHHFRSSMLYKKEIHTKHDINYKLGLSNVGFREETFISFKSIIAGYKIAVHTGAKYWHLQTPSGGCRYPNYAQLVQVDDLTFRKWFIKQFQKYGNFIEKYNKEVIKV